ncbi:hypothetical protein LSTR_LSTR011933 [Laodelphax striatellus]|uniref:Apolipoprotein D n=1 Tax=Laodelphax striatellus TaxID=195883 RepID=A0A482WY73_LAOST|nr:hypothetical protein LSTR_LSTR011933 [Laodelphax striatellus]
MAYYVKVFMVIAALSSIYESVYGQSVGYGSCPDVTVLSNFDPSKYTGRWYEAERMFNKQEVGGSCVTSDYAVEKDSLFRNTGNLFVTNTMKDRNGIVSSISGKAVPLDESSSEAKYVLSYDGNLSGGTYWVLDTDYNNYSVVYSCNSIGPVLNMKYVWLFTREPEAPQYILDYMKSFLKEKGLSSILLGKTNQENCNYPISAYVPIYT